MTLTVRKLVIDVFRAFERAGIEPRAGEFRRFLRAHGLKFSDAEMKPFFLKIKNRSAVHKSPVDDVSKPEKMVRAPNAHQPRTTGVVQTSTKNGARANLAPTSHHGSGATRARDKVFPVTNASPNGDAAFAHAREQQPVHNQPDQDDAQALCEFFLTVGIERGVIGGHFGMDPALWASRNVMVAQKLVRAHGLEACKVKALAFFAAVESRSIRRSPTLDSLASCWDYAELRTEAAGQKIAWLQDAIDQLGGA